MNNLKQILKYALSLLLAAVLLWLCLRNTDWALFLEAVKGCRWDYMALSMVIGIVVVWVKALRWRMLMRPLDPSIDVVTCFNAYNIGLAANIALPKAGEVIKLGYIVKHSSKGEDGKHLITVDKALGTLITERVWELAVMILLALGALVISRDNVAGFMSGTFSGGGAASMWLLVLGLLAALAAFVTLSYFMREKGGIWTRTWSVIQGTLEGLTAFRKMKGWPIFIVYTAIVWALYLLSAYFAIRSVGHIEEFASLGLAEAYIIMVIGSLSTIIPVPGGFGAYHGIVAGAMLSLWNIPLGAGMILATVCHESQIVVQIVCGLSSYVHELFRK